MGQAYSLAIDIPNANFATASPLCELICTATDHPAVTEVWMTILTALAGAGTIAVGLGKPAAAGVTPVNQIYAAADDGGNTATSWLSVATQWATAPTAPATFLRRSTFTSGNSIGGLLRWQFSDGLVLMPSTTLVVWCLSAGASAPGAIRSDVSFTLDG